MRCRRCHTKIAPGRKTCPVCGTLVRKRRGSVRLSPSAGGSRFDDMVDRVFIPVRSRSGFDGRKLLLGVLLAAVGAAIILLSTSGCRSGSCAGGCTGCSGCAACASCDSCLSCDSCAGEEELTELSRNSSKPSSIYCVNDNLLYVSGTKLVSQSPNGSAVLAEGVNISNIAARDGYVYYVQGGSIWRVPLNGSAAGECIVDPSAVNSDAGLTSVLGFALSEYGICYWGVENNIYRIMLRIPDALRTSEAAVRQLYSGALTNIQAYGDRIFFVSREESDNGILYSVFLADSSGEFRCTAVTDTPVGYYAISRGSAYFCRYINGQNTLSQLDLATGKMRGSWVIGDIGGLFATDEWIYYYTNVPTDGGSVMRMESGSDHATRIFFDESEIMLSGVCGDWFALYTDLSAVVADRYSNATYYIFDATTKEQILSLPTA